VRNLVDSGGEADVGTLVGAQVAASDDTFANAATALHELHVPKLEDAGLIEAPEDGTVVELAVEPERARELLDAAE
jgi:DNA-binding transcriptional ArsR family regulator